jgi:hypothetical protein
MWTVLWSSSCPFLVQSRLIFIHTTTCTTTRFYTPLTSPFCSSSAARILGARSSTGVSLLKPSLSHEVRKRHYNLLRSLSSIDRPPNTKLDQLRAFRGQNKSGEKRSLSPSWMKMKNKMSGKRGRSPLPIGTTEDTSVIPQIGGSDVPKGSDLSQGSIALSGPTYIIPAFLCMTPGGM